MDGAMSNNVLVLGPVFIPMTGAFISLGLARLNRAQRWVAVAAALGAWFASMILLLQNWGIGHEAVATSTLDSIAIQIYRMGDWYPPYGIILVADMLSSFFGVMAATALLGGTLYVLTSRERSVSRPVFVPAFLIMMTGLNGAFYTGDIFTLFVFVEVMVLASVVMVAISDDPFGLEAAIKYLLVSAMGSLLLLVAIAAIYATFGTLNMADIARLLQTGERPLLARAGEITLIAAFLLKSAVFPLHFWGPDFNVTAPTAVSAMESGVVVKIGVYGIIRSITLFYQMEASTIQDILLVLGVIGILFGSISAMRTYNPKRMLAYSTLAQIGFILVGIGWGTPLALVGAIVYAFNHALIKSSLLLLSGVVISKTRIKTGLFTRLVGVGKTLPATGILFLIGGLALAGVPPLNGFISKLALTEGGVEAHAWFTLGLVEFGGLLTLIYILRAYVLMFQRQQSEDTVAIEPPGRSDPVFAPALLILLCIGLGLYAEPLIEVAQMTVDQLSHPTQYISAVLGG